MSHLPVLDAGKLASLREFGGEELEKKLVRLFLEYVPGQLERVKTAAGKKDWNGLKLATHTIGSSARNVGAAALMKLARTMEQLVEQKDLKAIAMVRELETAYAQVAALLQQHVKG
jgi:HPt (histidine-containing phosphotransfer) domain-containing protein